MATPNKQAGHNLRDTERRGQLRCQSLIGRAYYPTLSRTFDVHYRGSLLVVRAKSYEIFHFAFVLHHFPLVAGGLKTREMTG